MSSSDPLELFLPPAQRWFRTALGEPTPAQRQGWPVIAAGHNTLILAPTGSGKTFAAFFACLDALWRQESLPPGVRVLYVSPLKALNNDIYRNLQVPLLGVAETARQLGFKLPEIDIAVRTGDTPSVERQRLLRKPPHVLITTPESLHLLLTSKARETLRQVTHCIVDEIHALCPNKRGVFLSLLLERLASLNTRNFVRIGLSATQRPLEEVARYLGGSDWTSDRLVPRPVVIVDAGMRRDLDLRVVSPVDDFSALPDKSIWPAIHRLLGAEVRKHRSTIIFANNRRSVERITANLNDAEEIAQAHHGSISLEVRQRTERALKEGRLPAVVATASLELGIDMGAVDLVCQVESPGNVARALQRVGRAGHLVGKKAKGRLIPKTQADLLEQAVLAHEMVAGNVEPVQVPPNCLDVLAQQIVAMTALDAWDVPGLYALVRRAYPYRDLTPQAFEAVLEMVSGRYRFGAGNAVAALQPRISWDRVHNRLLTLPGSQHLALVNGGTIPDTGQYHTYTSTGVRIGELDEEFIYERRGGDTFLLGTNAWRIDRIEANRVIVTPAVGTPAMVPFWRGEQTGRSFGLGSALGRFLRQLAERVDSPQCLDWLESDYFLTPGAARNLRDYVRRQLQGTGCLPTDRTLVIEASRDQLGDWQVILLSPFGSRLHLALRLALEATLSRRLGYRAQCLHHDDGILIRQADKDEPVLDLFHDLTPENVEQLILDELADSALFALRFRQNAARALLLPRTRPGKRAPLWLQRLRGRDLLQVARQHPDFPIVAETFRECLHDHLDVPRLQELLAGIRAGAIEVKTRRAETPSPFAAGLLFSFTAAFLYQADGTEAPPGQAAALDQQLLQQLLTPGRQTHLLDPRAVHQVERRLRGLGQPPRTTAEMAEWLRRLGDLAPSELAGRMPQFLEQLEADGLVQRLELPGSPEPQRWILSEEQEQYRQAFGRAPDDCQTAAEMILSRFLETHALVGLSDVLLRYPFDRDWTERKLAEWTDRGRILAVRPAEPAANLQWSAPLNLEQVQRGSLALLRREVVTCPASQFADFVLRWQGLHPAAQRSGPDNLGVSLTRLQGVPVPAELWEETILPSRITDYQPRWLDDRIAGGEWIWTCLNTSDSGPGALAFFSREQVRRLAQPPLPEAPQLDSSAAGVLAYLGSRGATFLADLAQDMQLAPSVVRSALWTLLRRGLVTNDRIDIIRHGEERETQSLGRAVRHPGTRISHTPRRGLDKPDGRWSCVPWGQPDPERQAILQAALLLERYGIVARELALLDPWMPPWRLLYEVLSRMELAGDVRRGYFVEGLSGAQFALPEAADLLRDLEPAAVNQAPVILLHSLDAANVYGSGAPFDIAMAEDGTRPLIRRAGTWLVIQAGRPVLLIEQHGKRLSSLPSAGVEQVQAAAACLPAILQRSQALAARHKLTVEEWNGHPVTTTEGRELLEASGFVRDYRGMTLYAHFSMTR